MDWVEDEIEELDKSTGDVRWLLRGKQGRQTCQAALRAQQKLETTNCGG